MTALANATVTEQNTDVVRRLFAAFAANDPTAIDRVLAPDFTAHGMPPEFGQGAAAMKVCAALMHSGLGDCHNELDDVIAEGDRVAVRYTTRAVHVGELFGIPPTGRSVTITGIEIYRVEGGAIAEYWGTADFSDITG